MKRMLIGLILIQLLFPSLAYAERVCSVHDGDTITLCNQARIRLHGIDAPELDQPYGYKSRDYLRTLVLDKVVKLDCSYGKSYKRKVCAVVLDSQDVQALMVKAGLAFDWPKYSKGEYLSLEEEAQKEHRGVWVQSNGGERPWIHRFKARAI